MPGDRARAGGEAGAGELVVDRVLEAHVDPADGVGQRVEAHEVDLGVVVDGQPREVADRAHQLLATRLGGADVDLARVGDAGLHQPVRLVGLRARVRRIDLVAAEGPGDRDVAVARDREGHRAAAVVGHPHQDHRVGVDDAVRGAGADRAQRVVGQRLSLRVGAAVDPDQQDVGRAVRGVADGAVAERPGRAHGARERRPGRAGQGEHEHREHDHREAQRAADRPPAALGRDVVAARGGRARGPRRRGPGTSVALPLPLPQRARLAGVAVAGRGSRAAGAVVVGRDGAVGAPRPGLGRPLGGPRRPPHLDRRGGELREVAAAQAGRFALGDGGVDVDVDVGRPARTSGAAAGGRGAVAAGRIATGLFALGPAGLVVVHRPGLPPRAGPRAALDLVHRRPGVRSTPATGSVRARNPWSPASRGPGGRRGSQIRRPLTGSGLLTRTTARRRVVATAGQMSISNALPTRVSRGGRDPRPVTRRVRCPP